MEARFVVQSKELASILTSMQPICNKRTTLDVTESILFEVAPRELTLKGTDLEISLQSTMAVDSDLEENKKFLISGKRIFDLVKEMDAEIAFTLSPNQLQLKSGGVDLTLNIQDSTDFPAFPERIENLMEIDADFFLQLISKVSFLIPQNNANHALNGMLLEVNAQGMSLVTTDGHCLACVTTKNLTLTEEKKWLLPKRAILELKKLLEASEGEKIFLGICGNQLVFSGKNFNFFSRLIVDSFPQYKPILDKEGFLPARLVKNSFIKTLKRTGCLLAGQFVSTDFTFSTGSVKVKLHNKEVGKIEESIALDEFTGETIDSKFYSPYLLNGLQVFPDDAISLYLKNSARPIIFESKTDDYHFTYLVMPVSPNQNQKPAPKQATT